MLLNALWAEDTDRWLHARCGRHTAGGGAQQLMRAASCGQPTEEAQHRLVVRRPTRYADATQNLRGESDTLGLISNFYWCRATYISAVIQSLNVHEARET